MPTLNVAGRVTSPFPYPRAEQLEKLEKLKWSGHLGSEMTRVCARCDASFREMSIESGEKDKVDGWIKQHRLFAMFLLKVVTAYSLFLGKCTITFQLHLR